MNKTFVKRKANWVSRVGHSTLLAMANILYHISKYVAAISDIPEGAQ